MRFISATQYLCEADELVSMTERMKSLLNLEQCESLARWLKTATAKSIHADGL